MEREGGGRGRKVGGRWEEGRRGSVASSFATTSLSMNWRGDRVTVEPASTSEVGEGGGRKEGGREGGGRERKEGRWLRDM